MHRDSTLGSLIEVPIGLAGSSGIVAAVGRRGTGGWAEADQARLRGLVSPSRMALPFALLPFVLVALQTFYTRPMESPQVPAPADSIAS